MTDLTPNEQKRRDLLSLIADAIGQAEGSPECDRRHDELAAEAVLDAIEAKYWIEKK